MSMKTTEFWSEGHPNFCPFAIGDKVIRKVHMSGSSAINKFKERFSGPFVITKVQSNGLSYEIKKQEKQTIYKVHHRDIRPWRELPPNIKKYVVDDFSAICPFVPVDATESSDSYVPFIPVSSVSSSFSGFSGSSDVELISVDFAKGASYVHEREVDSFGSSQLSSKQNDKSVSPFFNSSPCPLASLHCSETVADLPVIHSSPINTGASVAKHFSECECLGLFPILEQTILAQEEVVSKSLELWNDLSMITLDESKDHNRRLTSSKIDSFIPSDDYIDSSNLQSCVIRNDTDINNFSGFVGNETISNGLSLLNDMKTLITAGRSCINKGRDRAVSLRRELHERRLSLTHGSSIVSNRDCSVSTVAGEMSDVVMELNPRFSTPGRMLRSQGNVPEYPNVQYSTLEYRRRDSHL